VDRRTLDFGVLEEVLLLVRLLVDLARTSSGARDEVHDSSNLAHGGLHGGDGLEEVRRRDAKRRRRL
jgi:hypothetical protein